jgi:hypothetical protein
LIEFSVPHTACLVIAFPVYITLLLEFVSPRLSNPNKGAHRSRELKNPHEMPPKKRPTREPPAEGSSHGARGHVLTTTEVNNPTTQILHPNQRIHPHKLMMYPLTWEGPKAQQVNHRLRKNWSSPMLLFETKTHISRLKP